MTWDPAVLRKYNTTGHFRLLNQVRSELRGNPLIRPRDGETVGAANRSRSLTRAIEARAQAGPSRSRRAPVAGAEVVVVLDPSSLPQAEGSLASLPWRERPDAGGSDGDGGVGSFRDRLSAIDMR
ncbi:MAG: hypothetical protein VKN15_01890 [Cyanobacteriota bacterium]|nr:hypothetical protein [Cyanobacteriota bacterium]